MRFFLWKGISDMHLGKDAEGNFQIIKMGTPEGKVSEEK